MITKNIIFLATCSTLLASAAFADVVPQTGPAGSGTQVGGTYPAGIGYQVGGPTPPSPAPYYPAGRGYEVNSGGTYPAGIGYQTHERHHHGHRHHNDGVSFSFNVSDTSNPPIIINSSPRPSYGPAPRWVAEQGGTPRNAVVGGSQPNPAATLYVCRGAYQGGMHPGKLIAGQCNISWGNDEISLPRYQVLVSRANLRWVAASDGDVPPGAIAGGYEYGHSLYICQAHYRGGRHPGKLLDSGCSIGWGGKAVTVADYRVLVR